MRFLTKIVSIFLLVAASSACSHQPEQNEEPALPIRVQLLALNDFHGQITSRMVAGKEIGGAAVIRSHFAREQAEFKGETFVIHVGDFVGASSPESGLLQDEPSIMFFNLLGNKWCKSADPRCNLIGTLGNHEFDKGEDELVRLITGGNHRNGPFLDNPFRGSLATYISSNAIGSPIDRCVSPFTLKSLSGVTIAFIGATTSTIPDIVRRGNADHTKFLDEAKSINRHVRLLRKSGIRAFVALVHEGGAQTPYSGPTRQEAEEVKGRILPIVNALDSDVDVVLSAHFHEFTNAFIKNASGAPTLVTQAEASGTAYADIEFQLDPRSGDVVDKTASIKKTWAEAVSPDPEALALLQRARDAVLPRISRLIGHIETPVTRKTSKAGESALGNLVTDAQRLAVNADIAFMNPGGLRDDLDAGDISWGELRAIHPFGNSVRGMSLSGRQIAELLEQQWQGKKATILQVSGLTYTWSENPIDGPRVSAIRVGGKPIDSDRRYRVAANDFLALGGDGFSVFNDGNKVEDGPLDIEALETYLTSSRTVKRGEIEGRIRKIVRQQKK